MKNDDDVTVQPAVGTPVERKLGHLPPQAAGQAHMMSVCIPGQRDHGHWYSPDAVREYVTAERKRWAPLAAELRHMAENYEMPDGDYCPVNMGMWAEDWLRKLGRA